MLALRSCFPNNKISKRIILKVLFTNHYFLNMLKLSFIKVIKSLVKTYLTSLIILILTGFPIFSKSACVKVSFEHLQATEGDFCVECLYERNQTQNQREILVPTLSCFKKSISSRNTINDLNTSCQNNRIYNLRGPMCVSNEYATTTARVFHEISQCLDIKDPSFFFALLNRESRFQITATSGTGASCYGQLTGVAITDINERFIPIKVKNPNKCKSLNENWNQLTTRGNRKTKSAVCTAHSNPYSCLFYSAVYYQSALKKARKLIKELRVITIKLHSNPNRILIFQGEREYQKYFTEKNINRNNIKEKKFISIFQDEEFVAQTIALKGYNGGPQSVRNLFRQYTNTIKGVLWTKDNLGSTYRAEIFNKKPFGIPSSDFITTFGQYVRRYYSGRNRYQTASFAKDVLRDFASITKGSPSCGNIPIRQLSNPKRQFRAQGII